MELQGRIIMIGNTQVVSDKFKKRDFVIETSEKYPQSIQIQLTQAKCDLIDKVKIGDDVNVHINIQGRSWASPQGETKYFNTISAWKIDFVSSGNNITNDDIASENVASDDFVPTVDDGNLPF
jgi:hypothetical protein